MSTTAIKLVCCCLFIASANGLGCIPALCDGTSDNQIANAPCDKDAKHCGLYGGKRSDNSLVKGVDIRCAVNKTVKAPFDGALSFYRPRGGQNASKFVDKGFQIVGSGQWLGYTARIAYITPIRYGTSVKQNDPLGYNIDQNYLSEGDTGKEHHILFVLYKEGAPVDPTYHLTQCMCTGQICETNSNNALIGSPFAHKTGIGKGYEINCPDIPNSDRDVRVFSPIEASALGRFRPFANENNASFACVNDGVFLEGVGKWQDFVVHIYNAHFVVEPGLGLIAQGKHVANRLTCAGTSKSIFVEFRYKGRLVDVSKMILARNCSLPKLLPD